MLSVISVGLFGMVGALARFSLGLISNGGFPYGTLTVNLLGCLFLGWFTIKVKPIKSIHPYIKTGIGTGFIGSFTTFSTFSVETIHLIHTGRIPSAVIYCMCSMVGGWLFVWIGFRLGSLNKGKKEEVQDDC